jgi:hypothetical protein
MDRGKTDVLLRKEKILIPVPATLSTITKKKKKYEAFRFFGDTKYVHKLFVYIAVAEIVTGNSYKQEQ